MQELKQKAHFLGLAIKKRVNKLINKIESKIKNFFKIGFYKTENGYFRKDLTYIENNKTLKSKLFGVDLGDLV